MGRSRAVVLITILFAWLVLFGSVLGGRRTFAFRDSAHYYLPLFTWARNEWAAGRVPLWNPQENCGVPAVAEAASSTFYPGKLVFLLPGDATLPYNLYVAGHVLLAAGSAYLLARGLRSSVTGAGLCAISYALGGNVLFQYCNVVFLVGAAWMPLAALAGERLLRTRRWRWALPLGIVLGLMILGGDPQSAYHVGLLLCGYGLLLSWRWRLRIRQCPPVHQRPRRVRSARAPLRPRPSWRFLPPRFLPPRFLLTRMRRHRIVLLGGAAALGVALSAIQVLPSAAWTRHSERATYDQPRSIYEAASEFARSFENPVTGDPDGLDLDTLDPDDPHASANAGERPSPPPAPLTQRVVAGLFGRPASGTHHEQAYQFSVAPWRLPEFLWANVSGRLFPENHRWLNVIPAEGRVWNPSLYMGLLPLVLAMSVLRPWGRRVRQRWLSWAVILAVLAACGWYGIGWLIEELRVGWWGGDPKNAIIGQPVGGLYWLMNVLLPGYVYFRFPAKLLVVAAMGLSVLAAWGWDRMTSHGWRAARRWLAGIAICSAFAALGVLLVQFQNLHFNWFDTVAADPVFGPLDSDGALWDVMFSLLQATVLSVVLLAVLRASVYLGTARLGAIVLWITAIDLVVAHAWSIPTVPTSLSVGPSAVVGVIDSLDQGWALSDDELASRFRLHRGSPARWRPDRWSRETDPARMAAIIAWERDTLFPKYPLVNDTWLVEAYGTISSADFRALLRVARDHGPRVRGGSAEPHPAVLRALHANYVLLPAGNELPGGTALPFVRVADDAQLWRLDQTWPRAWVVRDVRRLPRLRHPSRAALETRARDVFFPAGRPRDLRRTAVIETLSVIETPSVIEAPSAIDAGRTLGPFGPESDLQTDPNGEPQRDPATHRETSDTCRITHDSPLRVEITAQLSRPGLLVLSDLYADGWTAYWDDGRQIPVGRQTPVVLPIHRANRIMRSVWLPAGKSRLTFVYRPLAFYVGAAISLVAWCLVIAASRRLIYK